MTESSLYSKIRVDDQIELVLEKGVSYQNELVLEELS